MKELRGNQAGVKGRNSFLFKPRRKTHRSTSGMKCFSFTNAFQQHNQQSKITIGNISFLIRLTTSTRDVRNVHEYNMNMMNNA